MKRIVFSVLAVFSLITQSAYAQISCFQLDGAEVVSSETSPQYLGFFGSVYASDSIMNQYGTYGSRFSSTSVRNNYGSYGGQYSIYSANNQYTTSPPLIFKNGQFLAYLTTNAYLFPSVSIAEIDASCTFYSSLPSQSGTPELPEKPSSLTGLKASDGEDSDYILLTWNGSNRATGYLIYASLSEDGEQTLIGSTDTTSKFVPGGTPGAEYYFFVYPYNSAGVGTGMWDTGFVKQTTSPSTLPDKLTTRVDGRSSSAKISGSAIQVSSGMFVDRVSAPEQVSIQVNIQPEQAHIGKGASLIVAVSVYGQLFLFDEIGQLHVLDGSNVYVHRAISNLAESNAFELFNGIFGVLDRANYEIYAGYLLDGETSLGQVIFNADPIRLSVE